MAEMALVLPLLVLLIFGAIELARLANVNAVLHSACREGARYSAVPLASNDSLPGVSQVVNQVVQFAAADGIQLNPSAVSVNQAVDQQVDGITTSYSQVQVQYSFQFVVPIFSSLVPAVNLQPQAEMRNETN